MPSVRTPNGITGFPPGQEVRFVSANREKGLLLVTDGVYQLEVGPSHLTNDLDVADLARRQDEQSQRTLFTAQENARKFDEQARHQVLVDHAKDVAQMKLASGMGRTPTALDAPVRQVGGVYPYGTYYYNSAYYGNPYYYLNRY